MIFDGHCSKLKLYKHWQSFRLFQYVEIPAEKGLQKYKSILRLAARKARKNLLKKPTHQCTIPEEYRDQLKQIFVYWSLPSSEVSSLTGPKQVAVRVESSVSYLVRVSTVILTISSLFHKAFYIKFVVRSL